MDYALKRIHPDGVDAALEKADRYRELNQPAEAAAPPPFSSSTVLEISGGSRVPSGRESARGMRSTTRADHPRTRQTQERYVSLLHDMGQLDELS